jgi:hypothetical protein
VSGAAVPDIPDQLEPARHRDLEGRGHQPWVRRVVLSLLGALIVLGLLNVFGQRSETTRAAGPAARIDVRGPTKVRGGLMYQERITVRAIQAIQYPRLILAQGWADGLQINTIEPQPQSESSRAGKLVFSFDKMAAGDKLELWVDYQVNPTHVGTTDMSVEVDDQTTSLVRLSRTLTTFP